MQDAKKILKTGELAQDDGYDYIGGSKSRSQSFANTKEQSSDDSGGSEESSEYSVTPV